MEVEVSIPNGRTISVRIHSGTTASSLKADLLDELGLKSGHGFSIVVAGASSIVDLGSGGVSNKSCRYLLDLKVQQKWVAY